MPWWADHRKAPGGARNSCVPSLSKALAGRWADVLHNLSGGYRESAPTHIRPWPFRPPKNRVARPRLRPELKQDANPLLHRKPPQLVNAIFRIADTSRPSTRKFRVRIVIHLMTHLLLVNEPSPAFPLFLRKRNQRRPLHTSIATCYGRVHAFYTPAANGFSAAGGPQ